MTVNKEINSIEKSITNLDLARDRQIRRKIFGPRLVVLGSRFPLWGLTMFTS